MLTGLMAAVVATAAAINVASPDLLRTHGPDDQGVMQFQRPPTPITSPVTAPSGVPVATPIPTSNVPAPETRMPLLTMPTQPPARPDPAPTVVPPPAREGEPPAPGKPCAVGLLLDPLLGVCVAT